MLEITDEEYEELFGEREHDWPCGDYAPDGILQCTRSLLHQGRHIATGMDDVYQIWEAREGLTQEEGD